MPFADELLGSAAVDHLATVTGSQAVRSTGAALDGLTLRQRCDLLTAALLDDVPGGLAPLAALTRRALTDGLTGWAVWPVTEAVTTRALASGSPEDFDLAMDLQAELTPRLSAEFGVRRLLAHDLDRALPHLARWAGDPDPAVRRLASEGSRPYLPWATRVPRITAAPELLVPVLDLLRHDPDEVVRRSVANHLNDVSRHAADLVVDTTTRWQADADPHTARLVRHALRTLVKKGHPGALGVLGFDMAVRCTVTGPTLGATTVPWAGTLDFSAAVTNTDSTPARLVVDYVVHFQKANGTLTTKTFKISTPTLGPGETLTVNRSHSFRELTTRRHHPGEHALALQVNGVPTPPQAFTLLPAD